MTRFAWYLYARIRFVALFLKIVWRKWDIVELEDGQKKVVRVTFKSAYEVAKTVWL